MGELSGVSKTYRCLVIVSLTELLFSLRCVLRFWMHLICTVGLCSVLVPAMPLLHVELIRYAVDYSILVHRAVFVFLRVPGVLLGPPAFVFQNPTLIIRLLFCC